MRGLSQDELERVVRTDIGRLERGERTASPRTQERVAILLSCCIGDVFLVETASVVSVRQAAELAGACEKTIRRRIDDRLFRGAPLPSGEWALSSCEVVRFAIERGAPLRSLKQLEGELQRGRARLLRMLRRQGVPTFAGPHSGIFADLHQTSELLARLEATPAPCLGCGSPCSSFSAFHCAQCVSELGNTALAERMHDESWRAAYCAKLIGRQPPTPKVTVAVPCFLCGHEMERPAWKDKQARERQRRQVCELCDGPWTGALVGARTKVARAKTPSEALDHAIAIGEELEAKIRQLRPPHFGRHPRPIPLDVAIEVLHVSRGLSDGEIRDLLERRRNTLEPLKRLLPEKPNGRYVTRRREQAGIRRRKSQDRGGEQLAISV